MSTDTLPPDDASLCSEDPPPVTPPPPTWDPSPDGWALLQALIDVLQDGIVLADANGTILLTNVALEAMVGYVREGLQGQSVELLVPERLRTKHVLLRTTYHRVPGIHRRIGIDIFARHCDGHEVPVLADLAPLWDTTRQLTLVFIRPRESPPDKEILIL
jgi:PAS domain S-box-containing protein